MADSKSVIRQFSESWIARIMRVVEYVETNVIGASSLRRKRSIGSDGGGCDPQNAIFDVTILGNPPPSTFVLIFSDLNAGLDPGDIPSLEFNTDDSKEDVKAVLITHPLIGSDDVIVTFGPWPNGTMRIEFTGALKKRDIAIPVSVWTFVSPGAGLFCACAQKGHA